MVVTFDTGNFSLTVDGTLNEESKAKMLENGMRYAIQRDVATGVYLALGGEKNDKGKASLPEGFKRESVEYNDENALAFVEAAEAQLAKLGTFKVSVGENVGGEGSAMKRATEFVDALITDNKDALVAVLSLYDATAKDADRDALIAIAHKAGVGKQAPKKAK